MGAVDRGYRVKGSARYPGQHQVELRLPIVTSDAVTRLAEADGLSRNKWIANVLATVVEQRRAELRSA